MNRKLLIFPIGSEYIQNAISTPYSDSLYLRPALCVSLYRYCPHFLSSSDKPTLYHLITNKKKTIDKDFPFFSVFVFNRADPTKMLFNVFPHLTYPLKVIEVGQKKMCKSLHFSIFHLYVFHPTLYISGLLSASTFIQASSKLCRYKFNIFNMIH